jgi:hypothetical protein
VTPAQAKAMVEEVDRNNDNRIDRYVSQRV